MSNVFRTPTIRKRTRLLRRARIFAGLYRPGLYDRFCWACRSFRRRLDSRAPVVRRHITPIESTERKNKPVAAVASERNDLEKKSNDFQRKHKTEIRYRPLF